MWWVVLMGLAWGADWEARMEQAVTEGWEQNPTLFEAVLTVEPRATRAGFLRYDDPLLNDPQVTALLVQRLVSGNDEPPVRRALADALVRSLPEGTGEWGDAWVALIAAEADPMVAETLVSGLRYAPVDVAMEGLRKALLSGLPQVRAAAARTIAWRKDGWLLTNELRQALDDSDEEVRSSASRALRWMEQ
jgi:HEAT repeat protein